MLQEGVVFKKITIIIGISFLCYSNPSHAGMEDLKEKVRPYIVKFLGTETAVKLLGHEPNTVELPEIPKVSKSASKCVNCNTGEDEKEKKIPKDKKAKLDYVFVDELYTSTRKVKGNKDELSRWFSILSQGGTREGVYRALVLDNTYRGLENYDSPVNDSVIEFATYFFPRFLNKSIKKKTLEKVNFYTLKRIATERSLEIVDEYLATNRENLYSWYAVLSGELAEKYPSVWKNKIRKSPRMISHKKWASKVPDQHIKSEVIIKIHKVFNSLN